MSSITVYQLDAAGVYVGTTTADESPLEPGVYLIPGGCVQVAPPPKPNDGKVYRQRYDNGWLLEEVPPPPAPAPAAPAPPVVFERYALKHALHKLGLLAGAQAHVDAVGTPVSHKLAWADKVSFAVNGDFMVALVDALALDAEEAAELVAEALDAPQV